MQQQVMAGMMVRICTLSDQSQVSVLGRLLAQIGRPKGANPRELAQWAQEPSPDDHERIMSTYSIGELFVHPPLSSCRP